MNRREFLKTIGLLGVTATLPEYLIAPATNEPAIPDHSRQHETTGFDVVGSRNDRPNFAGRVLIEPDQISAEAVRYWDYKKTKADDILIHFTVRNQLPIIPYKHFDFAILEGEGVYILGVGQMCTPAPTITFTRKTSMQYHYTIRARPELIIWRR